MKRYLISAALILCSNALAMKHTPTKPTNTTANIHDLEPTIQAMIGAHSQALMRNRKCTLARLLHSTRNSITSENTVFTVHSSEESYILKAKL